MRKKHWGGLLVLLLLCGGVRSQVKQESRTLVVNGKSGAAAVVQINSRTYVDLESLARIANGSFGFHGDQITLTLPGGSAASAPATVPEPEPPAARTGLSQNFMMAGIESLAEMREWASTMAYAIQNGYGVTEGWAADYREKAANALRQASAAASTDGDRNALQLLSNAFGFVREWSNELVEAKKNMDTAKYSTSPGALRNEPLSQKIITCGHFLGTMLGGGEFKDDPSCH